MQLQPDAPFSVLLMNVTHKPQVCGGLFCLLSFNSAVSKTDDRVGGRDDDEGLLLGGRRRRQYFMQ